MIPPSGTEPLIDHSFSTMPTRLLAMYRRPVSSHSTTTPTTRHTIQKMPAERSARAATTGEIPDESYHGKNVATFAISGDPTTQLLRERTREDCSDRNDPQSASVSCSLPDRQAREGRSAPRI